MKDIVPNASMPAMTDAMKRGWLAISQQRPRRCRCLDMAGGRARGRDRRESDKGHDRENDDVQDKNGGIGRQIKRHRQIVRHAHEARPDHRGGDAAGRHPRNRLGAVMQRHQLGRGEAIHLQAGHGIAEDQAAEAHHEEVGGVEADAHHGGAGHAEQRADAKADAAAHPLHQQRRREHPDHHADVLHRDRQVGEIGAVIEGDDGQARGREHHGVAGLADRLAAGEQQQIAMGAPVEALRRIDLRLQSGLGVQCIHSCSCPTGLGRPRVPARAGRHASVHPAKSPFIQGLNGRFLLPSARMAAITFSAALLARPNCVSFAWRQGTPRRRGQPMSDDLNFTVQRPPAYGELTDVLPGLFWVRLPMPTAPNHVNCWLLDNGPGWTMVDCGLNTDDSFELWDKLWRGLLRSRPLQNLTFTHAHADHSGLAAFFVKETKCSVRMPLAEWLSGWKMWHEREEGPDEHFVAFLKRNGASDDDAAKIAEAQRRRNISADGRRANSSRIRDGDVIAMGKRDWRVITAGGHSAEHALFFCESDKILIAGDQILSHMTPSVIAPPAQPEANPMKDYLDSLTRLEALPPDTLVLPSHGLPFHGLHHAARPAARASSGPAR